MELLAKETGTFVQKRWSGTADRHNEIILVQSLELISIIKDTRGEQPHRLFN